MTGYAINPPNTPMVDQNGNVTPEWYRYFVQSRAQGDNTTNGSFLTVLDEEPTLPNSRRVQATAPIVVTDTGAGGVLDFDLADTPVVPGLYGAATKTVSFTATRRGRIQSAAEYDLDFANIAGTVTAGQGGTGLTSYTTGDFIYASGAATLAKLANVATGNVILSGGVGVASAWGKVGLTTHVSGTLPVANGGTGVTTSTGTGSTVLSNSPALVTPALGTPSAAVLTNASGLPLTTGVTGILPEANGGTATATAGFNGTGAYTNFTFENGKCTAAS